MAALAGALLGAGCNASWLANNETNRVVALPAAADAARLLYNAHYYQLLGRPEVALKNLQQAHEADPTNIKVVDALAQMYQEQGQFPQAQELYQETLTRYGENRALRNNWCFSFYLQGDLRRAESCFQEALARDPGNMAARNNLGLLWCRQGKLAEAKRLWEEAEGATLAKTRMNQALAFLGMSGPAYANLEEPGPGRPLAASSAKSPAEPASPAVEAARPLAAAPAIVASQDGSLVVAEGQASVKATPAAGLAEAAKAAAPQQPPAPVLVATQTVIQAPKPPITFAAAAPAAPAATRPTAGLLEAAKEAPAPAPPVAAFSSKSVAIQGKTVAKAPAPQQPAAPVIIATQTRPPAAKPPITVQAAAPAAPAATRPTAGLLETAKVAPAPAPPVAASSSKSVAVQGKTLAKAPAPARVLAAAAKVEAQRAAKEAAPPIILTAAERVGTNIEVLNGNGSRDLAHLARSLLFQEGFNVAQIGNYLDFGADSTVIYYGPGAERVARVLHSEIFPEARLAESAAFRNGVEIKILLGRDLLEHPRIMARLSGEEPGASPREPQPRPLASQRPAASLILASTAASGAARSPRPGPPLTPAKTLVHPKVPLGALTAEELIDSVIEIRNGTRAQMLAHQTRAQLSQQGFNVGIIGNYIDFGAETTVISYRPGTEKVAQALVSQFFPKAQLVESLKLRAGVDIRILLGSDLLAQPQTMARLTEKGNEGY
ncbi:MAG: LytR C-terminal domain-containing protein [Desulfobaccales bacterium]